MVASDNGDRGAHRVSFASFEFDLETLELKIGGVRLRLEDKPARVLAHLLGRAGALVPREELVELLWPGESHGNFEHGLNKAINKLRFVLADDPSKPRYVETLSRRGYRFIAELQIIESSSATLPVSHATPDLQSPEIQNHPAADSSISRLSDQFSASVDGGLASAPDTSELEIASAAAAGTATGMAEQKYKPLRHRVQTGPSRARNHRLQFLPKTPCTKGALPGGVIPGKNGSIYGVTYSGGNYSCDLTGCGTVFKINHNGDLTLLHAFGGADGYYPNAGLVLDRFNNAYGTTMWGGAYGRGTVFKVTSSGNETVVYSFGGAANGAYPNGGLVRDAAGNLYGTTYQGGASNDGTIFKITPLGVFTVLYSFTGGASGANPYANLNLDQQGNIYGTTYSGGSQNFGTIFKLDASGNETVLHNFVKEGQGVHPSGLIIDASGNLYGTTYQGGKYNYGSVFELVP